MPGNSPILYSLVPIVAWEININILILHLKKAQKLNNLSRVMELLGKPEVLIQDSQFQVQTAVHNATVATESYMEETFAALSPGGLAFTISRSFVKVS